MTNPQTEIDLHPFGGGRMTSARRAVAGVVESVGGAFTVESLVDALTRAETSVGTATVYRAVSAMEAAGHVERIGVRGGSTLYVRCGEPHHHHHVICDGCGKVAAAECPLAASAPGSSDGFVVTRHEMTLYGLCPECARSGDA